MNGTSSNEGYYFPFFPLEYKITLHQFCPSSSDVSLVRCFLSWAQSARPAQHWGAGYQYTDAGVGGHGKAHWTHPSGAGDRGSAAAAQLFLHSWLQLAGQQPNPTALRADTQRSAGTAGPLCQDPTCTVWPFNCQVRATARKTGRQKEKCTCCSCKMAKRERDVTVSETEPKGMSLTETEIKM